MRRPRFGRWAVLAILALPPASAPAGTNAELLPDLVSLPPRSPRVATGAYVTDLGTPGLPSGCYPEERLQRKAERCLRFDLVVANVGEGPFELRFRRDGAVRGDARAVMQRIYRNGGGYRDRQADTYTFHARHAHFHYARFAQAHLWRSDDAGARLETRPVRSSRKIGFCMIDGEWRYGETPATYNQLGCRAPKAIDPRTGEVSLVNGISVGWADVYHWFLPDQFLEIAGLPDGLYLLETVVDAEDTIRETTEANNAAATLVRICGDVVRAGPDGSC